MILGMATLFGVVANAGGQLENSVATAAGAAAITAAVTAVGVNTVKSLADTAKLIQDGEEIHNILDDTREATEIFQEEITETVKVAGKETERVLGDRIRDETNRVIEDAGENYQRFHNEVNDLGETLTSEVSTSSLWMKLYNFGLANKLLIFNTLTDIAGLTADQIAAGGLRKKFEIIEDYLEFMNNNINIIDDKLDTLELNNQSRYNSLKNLLNQIIAGGTFDPVDLNIDFGPLNIFPNSRKIVVIDTSATITIDLTTMPEYQLGLRLKHLRMLDFNYQPNITAQKTDNIYLNLGANPSYTTSELTNTTVSSISSYRNLLTNVAHIFHPELNNSNQPSYKLHPGNYPMALNYAADKLILTFYNNNLNLNSFANKYTLTLLLSFA